MAEMHPSEFAVSVHKTPVRSYYYANYKVARGKYRIAIGYSEIEMTEHFVVKTGFYVTMHFPSHVVLEFAGFCIFLQSDNLRWALESDISEERARLPASMGFFPDELLRAMCSQIKF